MFATFTVANYGCFIWVTTMAQVGRPFFCPSSSPVYERNCMEKIPLTRALWTCTEAESCLQDLLTKLTDLQRHIPEDCDGLWLNILDEFHAAQNRLQAVKHDLIICVRTRENKLSDTLRNNEPKGL